jgi:radical SAM superfamily enzyme YgiQ (UPF0313 family)
VRITFVSGNREKLPDAVIPLGVLSVMASVPDRHEKRLVDLCFETYPLEALRAQLAEFRPDVVAIGMRNVQNADYTGYTDQLDYYRRLIETARATTAAPIVLGGSGFSVMPEALMERLRPDFGIAGEGELSFPALLDALERGADGAFLLDEIAGLYRRIDEQVVHRAITRFADLHTLARPDRSLLDPRYYARYAIDSVQTKRGCPLTCEYCTYPQIEGRIGRVREPAAVVDEMFHALEQQPSIRHFFIVDSVFNLPRTHAKNVCRALIERGWSIPWTCYANPLGFDAEFARLAREARCAGMEIGSDSGCDHILKRIRKGFTTRHIRALHELCKSEGVPDCHTFILGTEGETMHDVEESLEFIVSLDPYAAIIMIWVDDYEAMDPELRRERIAFRRTIEAHVRQFQHAFPYWVIPSLGVNFDTRLFRRLRRGGLHGPLWQYLRGPAIRASVAGAAAPSAQ